MLDYGNNTQHVLPVGMRLCGLFLKTNQANVPLIIRNVFKAVLPSTSILRVRQKFHLKFRAVLVQKPLICVGLANSDTRYSQKL